MTEPSVSAAPAAATVPESLDFLIDYPSDFPIKVMGLQHDAFVETILQLVQQHDPEFHGGKIEHRPSSKGTYLSLTVTVVATSREQLDNLYRALSSHDMVKYVL
ncbi:DUF493 family protein [Herbaspirillum sp. RTI4]|uniref:HP0495 family protein n=1 Tax=Herbaspirillum sp. RTI4 TaxID=3048640 RepID=UPI002AB4DE58|nr:DUF493 family protein [Herbaspirillum sp. RTI4]MDY7577255.1 DUF493 family protein [Herbaspirillum sp. RTI4]MEA9980545.1 DUF493 family protein [Herbaspirillum sp. RTI4]